MWVTILAIVAAFEGRTLAAFSGLIICASATFLILLLAPWRHPGRGYRILMAPIYALLAVAIAWGVSTVEDPGGMGIQGLWFVWLLLPLTLPLWVVGNRRWDDGDNRQDGE